MPLLINCLVYTEEDLLNEEEERRDTIKGHKDSILYQRILFNLRKVIAMETQPKMDLVHWTTMRRRVSRASGR